MAVEEILAAGLSLIAVAVLSVIALVEPALAAWLTVENGVVEWLQVLLDAGAALLFGRELVRTGRVSPLDLVVVSCLIGLIIGEIDLDRILFGTKIIATRFFVNTKMALSWRVLAMLIVVGVPVAIGIFVVVRFRVFWSEGWAAVAQPWGRLLAASVALSVFTEAFEKQLGHVPGVSRFFLEELFEFVAAIGFFVSAAARSGSRASSGPRAG
jgi:hypothetical protein